ncbi:unnamed protein product, partial [Amoebophrya sp. A25]|eukprot:GSA25T00000001001.1
MMKHKIQQHTSVAFNMMDGSGSNVFAGENDKAISIGAGGSSASALSMMKLHGSGAAGPEHFAAAVDLGSGAGGGGGGASLGSRRSAWSPGNRRMPRRCFTSGALEDASSRLESDEGEE